MKVSNVILLAESYLNSMQFSPLASAGCQILNLHMPSKKTPMQGLFIFEKRCCMNAM
jgi:hypothetical protein